MNKILQFIDSLWAQISRLFFVRFEYELNLDSIKSANKKSKVIFILLHGGIIEWLILSSWCKQNGLGAILIANRMLVLLLAKPKYFFQILFRKIDYSELFLLSEECLRMLILPLHERKRLFTPTKSEILLSSIFKASNINNVEISLIPVFIRWRRHLRGVRSISEYLFGLSSKPNIIGKIWYLLRKRYDSVVMGLNLLSVNPEQEKSQDNLFEEDTYMRLSRNIRRKILIDYHNEMRIVLGPRYQPPHSVKESLIRSKDIQEVIQKLSLELLVDRKKLMTKAYKNLTEIVSQYSYRFIELMYVVLTWSLNLIFDKIDVDIDEIKKVREVLKSKAVVFVLAHRSHFDYLVTPYVLFINDIVTPHLAAGSNLSFWPLGPLFRKGGAFFIRRSFKGDQLYSICLKKYMEYLLKNKFNIGFFIEGTRSRTGKMLPPSYGILKMILESVRSGKLEDIALIPVSLCYDEVPEITTYSDELKGSEKPKESIVEIIKSRNVLRKKYGKVYLRFGNEIYAKKTINFDAKNEEEKRKNLQEIAISISKNINDITPITIASLIATSILCGNRYNTTFDEIAENSVLLYQYAMNFHPSLSKNLEENLAQSIDFIIKKFLKSNLLKATYEIPRVFSCVNSKIRELAYYKNSGIHCFISGAITLFAFATCRKKFIGSSSIPIEEIIQQSIFIRELLKFEFFFNPKDTFIEEIRKNLYFFFNLVNSQNVITDSTNYMFLAKLCGEFIESYATTFEYIKQTGKAFLSRKEFLRGLIKFAYFLDKKNILFFPESISKQNYINAIFFLSDQKHIKLEKKEGEFSIYLQKWSEELENLRKQLFEFLKDIEDIK